MKRIEYFFPIIEAIGVLRVNTEYNTNMYCIDMLSICLVNDLMSFVAHSLGYYDFNPERIAFHRSILINRIRTVAVYGTPGIHGLRYTAAACYTGHR